MKINFPDSRIAKYFALDSIKDRYIINYCVPEQSLVVCEQC